MKKKKRAKGKGKPKAPAKRAVKLPRTGMPAPDSVRAVVPFTSATGRRYRILKTTETDSYDVE